MHLGLIVPSFSERGEMRIPSLSLLASELAGRLDLTIVPLRNPAGLHLSPAGYDLLDPCGQALRFRRLVKDTLDLIRDRHRSRPFDVLHGYWLFEPGAIAAAAGRLLGVPVIASIGGAELVAMPEIGYGGSRTRRGRLINRAVMNSASLVTGGSGYVLDLARQLAPSVTGKLGFAPLPVEHASNQKPSRPGDHPHLLQVGAYLPVKGQDLAVRALAELSREYPTIRLTLVGENPHGYRQRIQTLAGQLGLSKQVRFFERVPHEELDHFYRDADLLLMPSRHESQGMVVLEAAARGLPTAGSRVGVVGDLAPGAAVAVTPGDHRELVNAVSELLHDERRRASIGNRARHVVAEHYAVEPVVSRWLELYEGIAGGN